MAVSRTSVWTGRIISGLVGIGLIVSARMKLAGGPEIEEGMAAFGLSPSILRPLAILELSCAIVYLIPQTAVLGAILVSGYMGGAICTHWRVGDNFLIQIAFGVLAWLGVFLREERLRWLIPFRRTTVHVAEHIPA